MRNEYEVYRHKNATDEEFTEMCKFFKQVESEDKDLCDAAQVNLNVGNYSSGKLEPASERGVLHFQSLVRGAVTAHRKAEKEAGAEIWPTRPWAGENEDVKFCQDLDGCGAVNGVNDW